MYKKILDSEKFTKIMQHLIFRVFSRSAIPLNPQFPLVLKKGGQLDEGGLLTYSTRQEG